MERKEQERVNKIEEKNKKAEERKKKKLQIDELNVKKAKEKQLLKLQRQEREKQKFEERERKKKAAIYSKLIKARKQLEKKKKVVCWLRLKRSSIPCKLRLAPPTDELTRPKATAVPNSAPSSPRIPPDCDPTSELLHPNSSTEIDNEESDSDDVPPGGVSGRPYGKLIEVNGHEGRWYRRPKDSYADDLMFEDDFDPYVDEFVCEDEVLTI